MRARLPTVPLSLSRVPWALRAALVAASVVAAVAWTSTPKAPSPPQLAPPLAASATAEPPLSGDAVGGDLDVASARETTPQPTPKRYYLNRMLRYTGHVSSPGGEPEFMARMPPPREYSSIVDVGTFDCGDWVVPGLKSGYTVYGFELDPANVERCLKKLAKEGLAEGSNFTRVAVDCTKGRDGYAFPDAVPKRPHLYLFLAGASDTNECVDVGDRTVSSYVRKREPGAAGARPGASGPAIIRLDEAIPAAAHASIFFIKIDTQGHEFRVLRGAERAFARGVEGVVMEVSPRLIRKQHGLDPAAALEFVYEKGFQCHDVGVHKYNSVHRPAEIHEWVAALEAEKTTKDAWGSWDDVVCWRQAGWSESRRLQQG